VKFNILANRKHQEYFREYEFGTVRVLKSEKSVLCPGGDELCAWYRS